MMVVEKPASIANPDDKYSPYCKETRKAILEIDARARGQKRREIVMLAEKLEKAGMPVNTICGEIVKRLHDVVHPTFVRRWLDSKYKDRRQSENAKKQVGHRKKKQPIPERNLATLVSPQVEDSIPIVIDNAGRPAYDTQMRSSPVGQPERDNPITGGMPDHRLHLLKAHNKSLTRVAASRQIIDKIIALDKNIKRHCFLYFNDNFEVVKVEPDGQGEALVRIRRQEQEAAARVFADLFLKMH